MKIRETLIALLIVGISSLTIAQQRNPNEEELLAASVPGIANVENEVLLKWLEEKCNKNGGPGAFESAMKAPGYLKHCMESVINVEEIQLEFEIAARRGQLDTVFKKYCERIPSFDKCVRNISVTVAPCLDPEVREGIKVNDKMTTAMLEFVCHNDGDRIAMFVAADGIDCIKSRLPELQLCLNSSFTSFFPISETFPDLSKHPLMNLNPEKCLAVEKFRNCAVSVLEKCSDPTPSNILDSLINYVRKVTPCEKLLDNTAPPTLAPTDMPKDAKPELSVGELQYKSLVKQIEAAEAQVRAANAQEQAAFAQEQAARVVEQVGKIFLKRNPTNRFTDI